ncbi:MAG: S8 family serine peptidase [Actinobacteria bacterium]|nr:S8 family serine peptidase [Actinomycetota bacterium]
MATSPNIDLVRDEILTTQPSITIQVPPRVAAEGVPRAVGVIGAEGTLGPTRARGTYRWTPRAALDPGRYTLVVEPMTDRASQPVTASVEVPFTVVDIAGKIPPRLRVESFTRVRLRSGGVERLPIDATARGRFYEFVKATDRRTGKPVALAFDQDGNKVNGDRVLAEYDAAQARRIGKIHPSLDATLRAARRGEAVLVDVWIDPDEPDPSPGDRPLHRGDIEAAAARADEMRQTYQARARAFTERLPEGSEVMNIDLLAPVITVRVPAAAMRRLAASEQVAGIYLHQEEGIDDLDDSIAVARSGIVHANGETGSGVRVAVWESGPTSNTNLVIAGAYKSSPSTSNHSQNVHAIIRNNESDTPNGHAPGCSLYSANDTKRAALTWAVKDQDCTIINQSFHRSAEPKSGVLSGDDLYGDWLALHWPYPLIVHAAGNYWDKDPDDIDPPSEEFVNHKGYNTLSVANHNDTASAMSTSSVFRNPFSSHGDRELPEISANGTFVTADGITMSGTSMASPAVAGVAALLQGTSPTLEHWPEGCRAILLAAASRNVVDQTWWSDVATGVDAKDGTGAVDAQEARSVALHRRWRDAPGTRRGWDIGLLTSSDFDADRLSKFEYRVTVPSFRFGPRTVKVALAWTSKVARHLGVIYTSHLAVDLDLRVFDSTGNPVAYSGSWDNSYEIAEFTGKPGETYTIKIQRWSGTDSTWFGIGWTVTGGFVFEWPFELVAAVLARNPN